MVQAHLNPSPTFAFVSGAMPASSSAFMYTLGGGAQIPIGARFIVDAAYRYSRIAADSTPSASPLNTNGMTFGLGYRF
ncbi:MAG TPA: hypothetical protein VN628_17635 [Vicinamibacterales bacterium]|nr:hypothetical protein [Vicinamibacterales bacterium]